VSARAIHSFVLLLSSLFPLLLLFSLPLPSTAALLSLPQIHRLCDISQVPSRAAPNKVRHHDDSNNRQHPSSSTPNRPPSHKTVYNRQASASLARLRPPGIAVGRDKSKRMIMSSPPQLCTNIVSALLMCRVCLRTAKSKTQQCTYPIHCGSS
jgi:hypothetical protein